MDRKIVIPSVSRHPGRFRGPLRSDEYNDFHEEVVKDITNLSNVVNLLYSSLSQSITAMDNEASHLRSQVRALLNQRNYLEKVGITNNLIVARYLDLGDSKGVSFPNGLDDRHSSMINVDFGEVTLPTTAIENKFYVTSLTSGAIVLPPDLIVRVRGTFDKLNGDGVVNYERGGKVSPGDSSLAFNGNNQTRWIRRVEFPIDSVIDQVECELTVTIPEGVSSEANTIEIYPFPNGLVDITELSTASDLGDNFIRVSSFSPEDNLITRRYHFPVKTVDQIRIRFRQRNWKEENGKKVFYYGLQELGLKLIDYDRTFSQGASFGTNNSFILKIDAPDGHSFNSLYRIDPNPNFFLEDFSKRHVHIRLNTSEEYSVGNIWDSDSMYAPQQLASPISANASTSLYAFVQLNYVNESGGSVSPFEIGTTPYLRGIGMAYTLNRS
jgi:hypothetical protein